MAPRPVVRSRSNPALKRVGAVLAGKEPDVVLLEGDRLVEEARAAALGFESVLVSDRRMERAAELEGAGLPVVVVEHGLLERASPLAGPPGILALCRAPKPRGELAAHTRALVLVAAGVADPGNLGALARSAEAAGAEGLCALGGASPWNEKALRGSMGSLLRLPVFRFGSAGEALAELERRGFRQVRAATRGGTPLERFDWSGPIALWVGGETGELPEEARGLEGVSIPMAGGVESLNVTVAAALLLYAAGRARGGGEARREGGAGAGGGAHGAGGAGGTGSASGAGGAGGAGGASGASGAQGEGRAAGAVGEGSGP